MKIVGIDPGGTSGICLHDTENRSFLRTQLGPHEHHLELYDYLMGEGPDLIVCERFDYRPRQGNVDLVPVEYIGVVRLYEQFCKYGHLEVFFQQQLAHDKGLWTDDKLKVIGLHLPGKPHANDATRQILYYVTNHMNDPQWIEKYGRLK